MKSDNRWIYVIGVAILAVLVVVGLMWGGGGDSSSTSDDDGDAGSDGDGDAGSSSEGDAAPSATSDDDATPGVNLLEGSESEGPAIGAVPEDPDECREYCADLAERGVLAEGMDRAACVEQLCHIDDGDSEEEGEPEAEPSAQRAADPEIPVMPDDCEEQCRLLDQRGELREGTSVEDCIAALCGSEE